MKVAINQKVFENFHEQFMVGLVLCTDINNTGSPADLHEMLRDVAELIRVNFNPINLQTHQLISAWKAAVAHFGGKFQHYQSNVERMMTLILEGDDPTSKNKLADLCNFMALKHITPVGATDAKKVAGNLEFAVAQGDEDFHINAKTTTVEKDELILSDGLDVLARKLDYDTSPKAEVSAKTKHALIHIEALPPISEAKLERIMDELAGLVRVFCGGKTKKAILTKARPSVEFS